MQACPHISTASREAHAQKLHHVNGGFMINDEEAPTGRPAGALGWAGLANLFYWIDRKNGIGGFWATQILPFGDVQSFTGYMEFERATYAALRTVKVA